MFLYAALSVAENILLIRLDIAEPLLAHGNACLLAVHIPYSRERQGLDLFKKCETGRIVARILIRAQGFDRRERCEEQSLLHAACTDDPCRNTVDGCIKEVETDVNTTLKAAPQNLLSDILELVVEDNNMVAVPSDRARNMEQDIIEEEECGGYLV